MTLATRPKVASHQTEPKRKDSEVRLNAALLCERVLEEKDGTLTAVRIVDRISADITASSGVPDPLTLPLPAAVLLVLKRDTPHATNHHIGIEFRSPSHEVLFAGEADLPIAAGAGKGANLILRVQIPVGANGMHWFDISIDGTRRTRIPLDVVLTRGEK